VLASPMMGGQEHNVKKILWILVGVSLNFGPFALAAPKGGDVATETYPEAQAQVKKRLDEIWAVAARKDFPKLASFHLYGPKFTEFKDGAPRGDAAANRREEEEQLSMLADPKIDTRDLAINVYGDTAIVTFNGDLSGKIQGKPVAMKQGATMVFVKYKGDWKIVHEHWSPIGAPPTTAAK
jgi:ketosteroid isomerase-like protein